ncbi:SHOCT domain-containing protein [Chloroflexota bacterium]
MWYMHESMGWWMVFGWVWMLIFWGGLIALIVWGISKLTGHSSSNPQRNSLDIAKERYAKGQISREEFEQLKRDLS